MNNNDGPECHEKQVTTLAIRVRALMKFQSSKFLFFWNNSEFLHILKEYKDLCDPKIRLITTNWRNIFGPHTTEHQALVGTIS